MTTDIRKFFEEEEFTNFIPALGFVLLNWDSFKPEDDVPPEPKSTDYNTHERSEL